MIALAGWRRFWHTCARLRDLEERYKALCGQYRAITDAADVLECMVAELRGELAVAVSGPCSVCAVLEAERDDALLKLDAVQATLVWLERDMKIT